MLSTLRLASVFADLAAILLSADQAAQKKTFGEIANLFVETDAKQLQLPGTKQSASSRRIVSHGWRSQWARSR
jgi:hypothetical protein